MKIIILFLVVFASTSLFAQSFVIERGEATYLVKLSFKKTEATSKDLKGKILCKNNLCEFLIAVSVNTFTSSDSNRDLNMQMTVESSKYPLAIAKGTFNLSDWDKASSTISAEVEFHGVKKKYDMVLTSKNPLHKKVVLIINLEAHNVERPSLFTMKIDNEVPIHFDLTWKQNG
jgi:hypothetical protein